MLQLTASKAAAGRWQQQAQRLQQRVATLEAKQQAVKPVPRSVAPRPAPRLPPQQRVSCSTSTSEDGGATGEAVAALHALQRVHRTTLQKLAAAQVTDCR